MSKVVFPVSYRYSFALVREECGRGLGGRLISWGEEQLAKSDPDRVNGPIKYTVADYTIDDKLIDGCTIVSVDRTPKRLIFSFKAPNQDRGWDQMFTFKDHADELDLGCRLDQNGTIWTIHITPDPLPSSPMQAGPGAADRVGYYGPKEPKPVDWFDRPATSNPPVTAAAVVDDETTIVSVPPP